MLTRLGLGMEGNEGCNRGNWLPDRVIGMVVVV